MMSYFGRALKLVFLLALAGASCASEPDYMRQNSGLPPLDIRVFLDEKPVSGLFELSTQLINRPKPSPSEMESIMAAILIPAIQGGKFKIRVEISDRAQNNWKDITADRRLQINNIMGRIAFNSRTSEITISPRPAGSGDGFGVEALTIYYTEDRRETRAAYTEVYFDTNQH